MSIKKPAKPLYTKKLIYILVTICIVQLTAYYISKEEPVVELHEAIKKSTTQFDAIEVERIKIQTALDDYMVKNDGQLPISLNALAPEFLKKVPLNPETAEPFLVEVMKGVPIVRADMSQVKRKKNLLK